MLGSVREFKKPTILTLLLIIGEVFIEVLIPFYTAELVNRIKAGVEMQSVVRLGLVLVLMALLSLACGAAAGFAGARASAGFARNLNEAGLLRYAWMLKTARNQSAVGLLRIARNLLLAVRRIAWNARMLGVANTARKQNVAERLQLVVPSGVKARGIFQPRPRRFQPCLVRRRLRKSVRFCNKRLREFRCGSRRTC